MDLVNQSDLATILGVSQPAVAKRVRLGRLTYADPGKKLFDPIAARAQWAAHRDRYRAPRRTPAAAADPLTARERRDLAEAQLVELELREKTGELVRRRDVESATMQINRALRERLLNLGDRISPAVPGDDDLRRLVNCLINDEVRLALREVCAAIESHDPAHDQPVGDANGT